MAQIKNSHTAPMIVDGVPIAPGKTAEVPTWSKIKNRDLFKSWVAAEIIEATEDDLDFGDNDGGNDDPTIESRTAELDKLTKAKLVEAAKTAGVEIADDATKAQIIDAMIAAEFAGNDGE